MVFCVFLDVRKPHKWGYPVRIADCWSEAETPTHVGADCHFGDGSRQASRLLAQASDAVAAWTKADAADVGFGTTRDAWQVAGA